MAQQVIGLGTFPNDQTGDPLRTALTKCNANFTELYNGSGGLAPQVAANTAAIAVNAASITALNSDLGPIQSRYSFSQLNSLFIAANTPTNLNVITNEGASAIFNGAAWVLTHPFVTVQSAIPFVLPSSGTVNNNGAIVLTTALPRVLTNGCYMYFAFGVLFSGSMPGCYWTVMSSTTAGTVFNNIYVGNQPTIPASTRAIVATGPGAYTQLTATGINFCYGTLPGTMMNANGQHEYRFVWQFPNNANNKQTNCLFGGVNIAGDIQTTAQFRAAWHHVRNQGNASHQTVFSSSTTSDTGTGTSINGALAVNTAISQEATIVGILTTDTDWIILESYSFTITPSTLADGNLAPVQVAPSTLTALAPAPALALGLTNSWLMNPPTVADVSFVKTDTTHKLYAGQWFNSPYPPFLNTNGYLQDVISNGVHYFAINQLGDGTTAGVVTQNASSQVGVLKLASVAVPFYYEIAVTLVTPSGYNRDNWPQVYCNPIEHNAANGGTFPYCEIDIDEGFVFGLNSFNSYFGPCTSFLDWVTGSSGSATTSNNASAGAAGGNIDRTQEHIWGLLFNPTTKIISWYIDGYLAFTKDVTTQIAAGRLTSKNYPIIFGADQHGANIPYQMLVRYVGLWGG